MKRDIIIKQMEKKGKHNIKVSKSREDNQKETLKLLGLAKNERQAAITSQRKKIDDRESIVKYFSTTKGDN